MRVQVRAGRAEDAEALAEILNDIIFTSGTTALETMPGPALTPR